MFYTQYDTKEYKPSVAGSGVKITYAPEFDKKGQFHLVEKGKFNVYEEIQTYADSVDIHILLKKYANGEVDALNQVAATYGDLTSMPDNFIDSMNLILSARDNFEHLPVDIKQKFNNSFEQYMSSVGSESWLTNMGFSQKPDTSTVVPEMVTPVQNSVQIDSAEVKE